LYPGDGDCQDGRVWWILLLMGSLSADELTMDLQGIGSLVWERICMARQYGLILCAFDDTKLLVRRSYLEYKCDEIEHN